MIVRNKLDLWVIQEILLDTLAGAHLQQKNIKQDRYETGRLLLTDPLPVVVPDDQGQPPPSEVLQHRQLYVRALLQVK